jgi:hypothetical protein
MTTVTSHSVAQNTVTSAKALLNEFPEQIVPAMAMSAVGSFVVTMVLTNGHLLFSGTAVALSVLAVAVDALVRPIMNKAFGDGLSDMGIIRTFANSVIVGSLLSVAAPLARPLLGVVLTVNIWQFAFFNTVLRVVLGGGSPNVATAYFWALKA